jgi:hypothetical protein
LLHNHPHLSSGAGTIGQKWPQYKGLSPTPLAIKKIPTTKFGAEKLHVDKWLATCLQWFLARRFFYPEDGGDMFLRNVSSQDLHGATSQKTAFLINNLV